MTDATNAAAKPKSAKSKSAKPKAGKKPSLVGRLVRFGAMLAGALVLASVLWVLAYRWVPIPTTTLMIERALFDGEEVRRNPISIDAIDRDLVRAVIGAEDARFCMHHGFDIEAIQDAIEEAQEGGRLRGASTISQQVAKNVFLWDGRGFIRKGLEAYFTLLIETLWPKRRIMEAYLNVAEWGDGLFGAEAAARVRFGASAQKLSTRQAALLAAVLPSPNKWRADKPGPYVRKRAGIIQRRMGVVRNDGLDACVWDAATLNGPRIADPKTGK